MKAVLGRGSIVVEWPDEELMKVLSRFRHRKDGSGEYEELFSYSKERNRLVTLPGFSERIKGLCDVKDGRMPMPDPDLQAARAGIDGVWHDGVTSAITAGGGVVSVPDMLGVSGFVASILRSFKVVDLLDRGTPMSLIAARDVGSMKRIAYDLRRLLPDRKVKTGETDCDDIVVATYADLVKFRTDLAGVFVGEVSEDFAEKPERVEGVSCIRNAARWGVMSSPFGGVRDVDMAVEGLFGTLVASMTYDDAVKAGVGAPVTVCWLPCPKPDAPAVSANESTLEAIVNGGLKFASIASEVMQRTPDDTGCLMYCHPNVVKSLRIDVPKVHKQVRYGARNTMLGQIESGEIRKAILAHGYVPCGFAHGVVVSTACGGADSVGVFPWRKVDPGSREKVYVVDFSHAWDVHNGRPGRLARNDEARKRRYAELGFSQLQVDGVDQLPFIG